MASLEEQAKAYVESHYGLDGTDEEQYQQQYDITLGQMRGEAEAGDQDE